MAKLTVDEFSELVAELVQHHGIGKIRSGLQRSNAIVSTRGLSNEKALARHLYQLSGGLARDGVASQATLALWENVLSSQMDEAATTALDALGAEVNEHLSDRQEVKDGAQAALESALRAYRDKLSEHVGPRKATLTMLSRAVPAVASILRNDPGFTDPSSPDADAAEPIS